MPADDGATISLDDLRKTIDAQRATCRVCGYEGHSLTAHLKEKHSMSVGQYKKKYGRDAKICSPAVSDLMRRMGRKPKASDDLQELLEDVTFPEDPKEALEGLSEGRDTDGLEELIPPIDHSFVLDMKLARAIAYGIATGKNVFIEGPTGCGKTMLATQVHAHAKLPMMRANMHGGVTAGTFLGYEQADPTKGTFFEKGTLPTAMEQGITTVVDEVDYTPPQIAAVMHPALEAGRKIYLPEAKLTIKAKKGFTVIATANTGGKGDAYGAYTGTEILNTAFLDRFPIKLKMDYLDKDAEEQMLLAKAPQGSSKHVPALVAAAREIREGFQQGNLAVTLSTRKLAEILEMTAHFGIEEAVKLGLTNWMDTDDEALVDAIVKRVGLS